MRSGRRITVSGQTTDAKGLFFLLASVSVALLLAALWLVLFLLEPRMASVGSGLVAVSRVVVMLAGAALVVAVASDFLSAAAGVRIIPGAAGQRVAIHVLLPVSERLGRLAGVSPDRVKAAFIDFNNALLKTTFRHAGHGRASPGVLLLLPHCLQSSECSRVLAGDIGNCGECGDCEMCELKQLLPRYGVRNRIVGGGALALTAVRELRPSAVVGVACERELVAAIKELRSVPVMAVINRRPEGPCRNTRVDVSQVDEALRILLKHTASHCSID